MRVVLLSLLAAGSLTASAIAQEAPPAEPAPPPQLPTMQDPPMTPEPTPVPAPGAPMAPGSAPAPGTPAVPVVPMAPEPPPPPPPPPPAPTEATAVFFRSQLERLCMPLVRDGDIAKLAPALGYKKKRGGTYEIQWAKGFKATVSDPGPNAHVCHVTVQHPIDGLGPTIDDLHAWAIYRDWTLEDNAKRTTDMERSTRKWEHNTADSREVIVLLTTRKVGGSPINSRYDQTELIYSFTTY